MAIDVLFGAVSATCMIWYAARIRNEVAALIALLNRLIYTAAVIAAAVSGASLFGYIGATLLADGATASLSLLLVRRRVRVRPRFRPRTWRANMAGSFSLGLMQIVGTVFLWIDSFLISLYLGPKDVAFYGIAFTIIVLVNSFSSNFMGSLLPTLSRSSPEDIPIVLERAFYAMLVIGLPIAAAGVLLRHEIIELVAGSRYLDSTAPLAILLSSIVFTFLNNVYGYACVAFSRVRVLVWVQVPAVALNVVLNLMLIPRYGIDAAAAATLVTEVLSFITTTMIFRARMRIRMSLRPAWKPALSTVVMVAAALAASSLWDTESAVANIILSASLLGVVYALSLIIVKGVPTDIAILGHQVSRRAVVMVNQLLHRGNGDE
jgi:O-antigen/teichoic acid export membrane protein